MSPAWAGAGQGQATRGTGEEREMPSQLCSLLSQSFTRLTELVLQAHRKELEGSSDTC